MPLGYEFRSNASTIKQYKLCIPFSSWVRPKTGTVQIHLVFFTVCSLNIIPWALIVLPSVVSKEALSCHCFFKLPMLSQLSRKMRLQRVPLHSPQCCSFLFLLFFKSRLKWATIGINNSIASNSESIERSSCFGLSEPPFLSWFLSVLVSSLTYLNFILISNPPVLLRRLHCRCSSIFSAQIHVVAERGLHLI